MGMISLRDVQEAGERLRGRVHLTPVLSSAALGELTGGSISLKAELFQRTGSFKVRGALNKLDSLTPDERSRGVVSISAGNHAQAVAYACGKSGVDCLVMMWKSASPLKVEATRGYGAEVDLSSADPDEAYDRLSAVTEETGRVLVHPFDDPVVMAGQGTVGLEICEQVPDVDTVIVATSGGGLISGVATAVKGLLPGSRVVAVQAKASPSLVEARRAGGSVRFRQEPSIADALTAPYLGASCYEVCDRLVDDVVLVSDDEIADAMRFLYARAKLACEPAAAAPVAAILGGGLDLKGRKVVAVISGGNVLPQVAASVLSG
jgi:threonine dehydratase